MGHGARHRCWGVQVSLAGTLLLGCPQWLDDRFEVSRAVLNGPGPPDAAGTGEDAATPPNTPPPPDISGSTPDASTPADAADGAPGDRPPDPAAVALSSSLVHRYRFDDGGATVFDSKGGANGNTVGAVQSGGAAIFGGDGQYVTLPSGLLSSHANASFEAWVIWEPDPADPEPAWQRIFDFGRNSAGAGLQGSDARGLFLSPRSSGPSGKLHLEFDDQGNENIDGPEPMPRNVLVQVVGVIDDDDDTMSLYQDGALHGARAFSLSLTTVNDDNNWLGRSQSADDDDFKGKILDFRVYSAALGKASVELSYRAGPDADW